ncbi:Allergen Api m 6.03 / Api m 6.04 like protein [Argiope bruennichi]|uniref:Allergen Api m 6.03 / Api m 6.04 like protein n=1 Tax=Argiope bruennichi TaxID=94029 RepID=A0A8T0ELV8_ARGBR|nr:Allergen Api m 6.03 / Api m 6.04 like protein [Argiope bruennichi]
MASTIHFLIFTGFIIAIIQIVTSEISDEWNVERSSVNPLSYTDEDRYSDHWTTENPLLAFSRKRTKCPENEHFTRCDANCQMTCDSYNKPILCPRICLWGCICDLGFVRGPDKKCIKPEECPNKQHSEIQQNFCPRGEEYSSCHSQCESTCIQGEEHKNICKKSRLCVPGCTCKAGLVRGPDGTCIYSTECPTTPPKEPPTKVCPENELYEKCTAACQRNCSNIDSALPCPRICQPGCVCKESMIRGKYGKCIETDECPKDTFSPEFDVTLNPPPYTDDDYHIPESVTKYPPVSEKVNRLAPQTEDPQFEQTEIPPVSQSKPSHPCPPLERWVVCGSHCQRNCSNKDDKDFRCRPICIPGCVCEQGLVRGPEGKCIEKDKCPPESDSEGTTHSTDLIMENEVTDGDINGRNASGDQFPFIPILCSRNEYLDPCPSSCPDDCNNYKDTNRNCKRVCVPKCMCKKGFVKGPNGKCINPSECPEKKETCRRDEMFSSCHGNCEKNCSNWAFDLICPKKCVSGCVCRPGRIRGPDGKCILFSECPRPKSDSVNYPDVFPIEDLPPVEPTENNALNFSPDAGCPNDNECTISCRHYGHRSGHCTGRDNLICSCHVENYENTENAPLFPVFLKSPPVLEDDECRITHPLCPDDKVCDCACRTLFPAKWGECTGPDHMTCMCHMN